MRLGGKRTRAGAADERVGNSTVLSREDARFLYRVAAGLAVVLLIVDVTGVFGWSVSSSALGLVALIVVLPIVEQLRKLKFGAWEAEFDERVERIEQRFSDLRENLDSPEESTGAEVLANGAPQPGPGESHVQASVLERVVWVDDLPDNNRLERAELQKRFDVVPVTSTAHGLREIGKDPAATLVITDAVRVEDGRTNFDAGIELLELLRESFPQVPVYVYCGAGSIEKQGQRLAATQARLVTSSWTVLGRQLRADARMAFEALVSDIVGRLGDSVEHQAMGIDFVVSRAGTTIGIEAKDWRRPPNKAAFESIVALAAKYLQDGVFAAAAIVTPRAVLNPGHIDRLPAGVVATTADQLPRVLRELWDGPGSAPTDAEDQD